MKIANVAAIAIALRISLTVIGRMKTSAGARPPVAKYPKLRIAKRGGALAGGSDFRHDLREVGNRSQVLVGHEVEPDFLGLLFPFESGAQAHVRHGVLEHEAVRSVVVGDFAQVNDRLDARHREVGVGEGEAEIGAARQQRGCFHASTLQHYFVAMTYIPEQLRSSSAMSAQSGASSSRPMPSVRRNLCCAMSLKPASCSSLRCIDGGWRLIMNGRLPSVSFQMPSEHPR